MECALSRVLLTCSLLGGLIRPLSEHPLSEFSL